MKKMYCFYHSSDLDGKCSGAIIYNMFFPEIEMHPIDYGVDFSKYFDEIVKGDVVYMVDFSLKKEDMRKLQKLCNFTWIDHHESAIKDCEDLQIKGIRGDKAACILTWEFLFEKSSVPRAVEYLGLWDIGIQTDQTVANLQYGLRSLPNDPWEEVWRELFSYIPVWILKRGSLIREYVEMEEEHLYNKAYVGVFEGVRAQFSNSRALKCKMGDISVSYLFSQGIGWKVQLRSDVVNCSEIAKKYGGGGHKNAAGFVLKDLPDYFVRTT